MDDNAGDRRSPRGRSRLRRAAVAAAAALAMLVAACGGHTAAAPNAQTGQRTTQNMDRFARCMRDHGVAGFYMLAGDNNPNEPELAIPGWHSTPVSGGSPVVGSAMKACQHIIGVQPASQGMQHKQFEQALTAAACMRSHGYPDWPDPQHGGPGGVNMPGPPAGVDTSSPQVQKAARTCKEPLP
jgi:hypothetical protein